MRHPSWLPTYFYSLIEILNNPEATDIASSVLLHHCTLFYRFDVKAGFAQTRDRSPHRMALNTECIRKRCNRRGL